VSDVEGHDVGSTPGEEHLGETAGRGADVEAVSTLRVEAPRLPRGEGVLELVRGAPDPPGPVLGDVDRRRLVSGRRGLARDTAADGDETALDELASLAA